MLGKAEGKDGSETRRVNTVDFTTTATPFFCKDDNLVSLLRPVVFCFSDITKENLLRK